MSIGLSDTAINSLRRRLRGRTLWLTEFTGDIYGRNPVILSYWQENVIEAKTGNGPMGEIYHSDSDIVAEWKFTFATATLSPDGYYPGGPIIVGVLDGAVADTPVLGALLVALLLRWHFL